MIDPIVRPSFFFFLTELKVKLKKWLEAETADIHISCMNVHNSEFKTNVESRNQEEVHAVTLLFNVWTIACHMTGRLSVTSVKIEFRLISE